MTKKQAVKKDSLSAFRKRSNPVNKLVRDQKLRLDVGCGNARQPGFVGMDKRKTPCTDIVHDLEVFPWPLPDDSCEIIVASHLIEHIKPWFQIDFMNECWRVMAPGGILLISTPYATSFGYCQDPTHCSPWNEATPMYFQPGNVLYNVYQPKPWKIESLAYDKIKNLEVGFRKQKEEQK